MKPSFTPTLSAPTDGLHRLSPIVEVLDPHEHRRLVGVTGAIALGGAVGTRTMASWELWQAVALVLVIMTIPAAVKWRADARRFGSTAAIAGAMVTVQGLHTIEHITQWVQRHILHEPLRAANGLLSPANSEWVHFLWNWAVLIPIVFLMFKGMRSVWAWALLAWAVAHTLEHTYMFIRYLQVSAELRALGFDDVTAQGLPGVIGDGGWLDLYAGLRTHLPFITTADRVDAHFAWNTGEILLVIPAVHRLLTTKVDAFRR